MDERRWIETFITPRGTAAAALGALGPGDDAALVGVAADEEVVLSVDVQIEGQHFENHWLGDDDLARRLLRSAQSDLAAMAARPIGFLISIESADLPGRVGEPFWRAIDEELALLEAPLLGGNIARSDGPLSLTCTAVGAVPRALALLRKGACPGDLLLVTGAPGAAATQRRQIAAGTPTSPTGPWLRPPVRLAEARWLVDVAGARAGIDISDGLWLDLQRLLAASGVDGEIDIGPLVNPSLAVEDVLAGGEDYELLIAAPPPALELCGEFEARFGVPLRAIGVVTPRESGDVDRPPAMKLTIDGKGFDGPTTGGWDPFQEE